VTRALSRLQALSRFLGAVVVVVFFVALFTPVPNILYRQLLVPADERPAQAIVALGAGIESDGVISSGSIQRCLHAILLHRRGLAPLLVLLGPSRGGVSEADVRARLAQDLGVPADAILTEARGRTTREEGLYTRERLQARGITRILLVTGAHHMLRARAVFQAAGFEVAAAPVDEVSGEADRPEARLGLTRALSMEWAGRIYYRLAGYI
jgi:uncharacterized SAM-binding protein YcdF (DUF218 family)